MKAQASGSSRVFDQYRHPSSSLRFSLHLPHHAGHSMQQLGGNGVPQRQQASDVWIMGLGSTAA